MEYETSTVQYNAIQLIYVVGQKLAPGKGGGGSKEFGEGKKGLCGRWSTELGDAFRQAGLGYLPLGRVELEKWPWLVVCIGNNKVMRGMGRPSAKRGRVALKFGGDLRQIKKSVQVKKLNLGWGTRRPVTIFGRRSKHPLSGERGWGCRKVELIKRSNNNTAGAKNRKERETTITYSQKTVKNEKEMAFTVGERGAYAYPKRRGIKRSSLLGKG